MTTILSGVAYVVNEHYKEPLRSARDLARRVGRMSPITQELFIRISESMRGQDSVYGKVIEIRVNGPVADPPDRPNWADLRIAARELSTLPLWHEVVFVQGREDSDESDTLLIHDR